MGEAESEKGVKRHLLAVVFTSDWPTDDSALIDFGGRLVGERGRGVLATFDNCHNAMLAMARASEVVPVSAGLAFGELAFEQGDLFGEAVVAAARLQSVCPVGSVFGTAMARAHLGDLSAEDLGPIELKGIGAVGHHRFSLDELTDAMRSRLLSDRRDVAILSTDIVGSTELLELEGTEAAIAVSRVFDLATTSACRRGEVLHVRGDGVVARFSSATDAIRAAVELHQFVADHGLRADSTPFALRSGVAVGADPEAEALALEANATPGQIAISESAEELAFDLAESVVAGLLSPSLVEASPFPVALSSNDELPLVGRASALSVLDDRWKAALLGTSNASFITGEAGIGKTRLVSTFAHACHAAGALVLFGSSDMEMAAPYRPFAEALAEVGFAESEDAFSDLLRPLFPHTHAEAAAPIDAAVGDRTQLFDAVSDALVSLGKVRPVLLVLDDLHWSDSSTALLLRHLLHRPPVGRVMVLGTFRDAEVDRTHPLFDVLNDQAVIGSITRVSLENLSVDDVAELVGANFDTEVGDREHRLADRIHRESSGLPFFTGEVLRHLSNDGAGSSDGVNLADGTDRLALPASLVDVVHQRLGRLDDATCRTLETAATAGLAFDLGVIAATMDTTMNVIVERLEAAERLALVHESGRAGHYQFDHALVRSALLSGLSATRVAMIHEQIAEALEGLPGDHNDALAHHWGNASGPVARQQAVRHLVLSAERDASALAWEAAKLRYEEALDLAGDDGVVDQRAIVAMHLARARTMRASGDSDYLAAMQETGRLARTAGLADVIAQVAINSTKPGTWFANANEPDQHLIGLCEDALEWPELDPELRCRVLSTLATNLAFDDDRTRRRAMVEEAVSLARSVGDPDLVASALIARHLAFWDPSTLDDRIEIIDELDRLARRRDNPDHLFLAGFFRASMLIECGRIPEARIVLSDLDEAIERTRNFWFRFLVNRMETALALASCQPQAKTLVDKLFEESFDTQADAAGTWGAQLGGLAIQTGTFGSMVDQLAAASERSRGQGVWSCSLAIARLDQGDIDGARDTLKGLKEAPLVSTSIGEAAMGVGDVDLAVTSLRSAVGQAKLLELPFCEVRSRRRLLEALPRGQWGTDELNTALELATTYEFPSEVAALEALKER